MLARALRRRRAVHVWEHVLQDETPTMSSPDHIVAQGLCDLGCGQRFPNILSCYTNEASSL